MQQNTKEELEQFLLQKETFYLYLYTPLCGTCQVASKMLIVVEAMLPKLKMIKADLNYLPDIAENYKIESVPCLLIFRKGMLEKKVYAFKSVPHIYELLKDL
jgi:thioredoxin 1